MKGLPMEIVRHMCEIGRAECLEDEDDEEERKRGTLQTHLTSWTCWCSRTSKTTTEKGMV
jgi:hypothetical protein